MKLDLDITFETHASNEYYYWIEVNDTGPLVGGMFIIRWIIGNTIGRWLP